MSFFGVRVNGNPTWAGTVTMTGKLNVTGQVTAGGNVVSSGVYLLSGGARSYVESGADGSVDIKKNDGSTYATLQALTIDYRQAASTFASIATMTNGPRAANPVAWLEVQVNGSSGRIPVW